MSLAAYATVVGLRRRSRELAAEMHEVEIDKDALAAKAKEERRELDDTETSLRKQTASLATVRRTLADTQIEYQTIVAAKDHELQTADAATRQLADQLTAARSDRDVSQRGRELYEEFWTRAREDVTHVTAERDDARRERDAMRVQREQAEHDRDSARAERDREATLRRRVETDIAQRAAEPAKPAIAVVPPFPASATTSAAVVIAPPVDAGVTPPTVSTPAAAPRPVAAP
jgi:chromosome segregation ATPase